MNPGKTFLNLHLQSELRMDVKCRRPRSEQEEMDLAIALSLAEADAPSPAVNLASPSPPVARPEARPVRPVQPAAATVTFGSKALQIMLTLPGAPTTSLRTDHLVQVHMEPPTTGWIMNAGVREALGMSRCTAARTFGKDDRS